MAPARTAQHGTAQYWTTRYASDGDYAPLSPQEKDLLAALPRPDGAQAVDLCCGTGATSNYLARLGYDTLGVDFVPAGIDRARQRVDPGATVRFQVADFAAEPELVAPASQQLIVCRLAAAFLDGALLVDRATHWLAPDGTLMIVLPDPRHLDPTRPRIYLDEQQISALVHGFASVERHTTETLLILLLRDWAPSHPTREKRPPVPNSCLGVGLVVQDPQTGRILLGRSARWPGMLEAPGGKLETGGPLVEGLAEAAVRELQEETGLQADAADVQLRTVLVDQREGVPRVTVAALVTATTGTPYAAEPTLVESWDWYAPAQLPADATLFKPTMDILAACLPAHFHPGRPLARAYPLHPDLTGLVTARHPLPNIARQNVPGDAPAQGEEIVRVYPAATAVLTDTEGRLLLVKCHNRGHWGCPGGVVEPGESPAQAAARELAEEVGLRRNAGRLLAVSWITTAAAGEYPGTQLYFDMGTVEPGVELLLQSEEVADAMWADPQDLEKWMGPLRAVRLHEALAARAGNHVQVIDSTRRQLDEDPLPTSAP